MNRPTDIKTLFHKYRDKCYGFLIKILGDRELARDLTQNIFLRLIEKKEELGVIRDWDNYIYLMCRNSAYDHLKKAGNDKKYRKYLLSYWEQPSNLIKPDAEKQMEAKHYSGILERSLRQLPDQQRIIFNLSKIEGLSHQKIAEMLNLSPNTVRNHLYRAIKSIRSAINPDTDFILLLMGIALLAN